MTLPIHEIVTRYPLLHDLIALHETRGFNPANASLAEALPDVGLAHRDVEEASAQLTRFAPRIKHAFPETIATNGIIESVLVDIPAMQCALAQDSGIPIPGRLA